MVGAKSVMSALCLNVSASPLATTAFLSATRRPSLFSTSQLQTTWRTVSTVARSVEARCTHTTQNSVRVRQAHMVRQAPEGL